LFGGKGGAMEIIDITVALHDAIPSWPGSCGFKLTQVTDLQHGDGCNGSHVTMDSHCGTHVDAPWHFLPDGTTAERLDLSKFIGPAYVAKVDDAHRAITAAVLDGLKIAKEVKRLLLRTSNSLFWARQERSFQKNFVAITADGAQWIVDRGLELVGIDYLSIQPFDAPSTTHQVILSAEIAVLEGLNLSSVEPGEYELICLPLKVVGGDGAPARAILRR